MKSTYLFDNELIEINGIEYEYSGVIYGEEEHRADEIDDLSRTDGEEIPLDIRDEIEEKCIDDMNKQVREQ
ncbi:MAG: hypothetical protein WC119_00875 [Synergistaceae bacterium]